MFSRTFGAAALLLGLGACSTLDPQTGSVDPHFGEASRWNAAAQIINPEPVYPPDGAQPGDMAAKTAPAVERYRTDRVKQPPAARTSGTTSGSGNDSPPGDGSGAGPR